MVTLNLRCCCGVPAKTRKNKKSCGTMSFVRDSEDVERCRMDFLAKDCKYSSHTFRFRVNIFDIARD